MAISPAIVESIKKHLRAYYAHTDQALQALSRRQQTWFRKHLLAGNADLEAAIRQAYPHLSKKGEIALTKIRGGLIQRGSALASADRRAWDAASERFKHSYEEIKAALPDFISFDSDRTAKTGGYEQAPKEYSLPDAHSFKTLSRIDREIGNTERSLARATQHVVFWRKHNAAGPVRRWDAWRDRLALHLKALHAQRARIAPGQRAGAVGGSIGSAPQPRPPNLQLPAAVSFGAFGPLDQELHRAQRLLADASGKAVYWRRHGQQANAHAWDVWRGHLSHHIRLLRARRASLATEARRSGRGVPAAPPIVEFEASIRVDRPLPGQGTPPRSPDMPDGQVKRGQTDLPAEDVQEDDAAPESGSGGGDTEATSWYQNPLVWLGFGLVAAIGLAVASRKGATTTQAASRRPQLTDASMTDAFGGPKNNPNRRKRRPKKNCGACQAGAKPRPNPKGSPVRTSTRSRK